ncbi:MAG: hypothetical protein HY905_18045 [Deltaproteobacteria bacterium]|nr:hypothetical protein [Deltaproteobacteria bacterium]
MRAVLAIVAAVAMGAAPAAWAGDEDDSDDEWECTCTGACDDHELSVTVDVCADDDDISEAVSDGANSCARELDGQCEAVGRCECTCHVTGEDC